MRSFASRYFYFARHLHARHQSPRKSLKLLPRPLGASCGRGRSRRAKSIVLRAHLSQLSPRRTTMRVYFVCLREIGRTVRVCAAIVEIIARRSAGGINQRYHSRARLEPLPPMDSVARPLARESDVADPACALRARRAWSKDGFLNPQAVSSGGFPGPAVSLVSPPSSPRCHGLDVLPEAFPFLVRRSRWFRPPLDGRVMAGLMSAVDIMGARRNSPRLATPLRQSLACSSR